MIDAHIIDARGVYLHTVSVDPMGPKPAGAIYEPVPGQQAGYQRIWMGSSWAQVADGDIQLPQEPEQPKASPITEVPRWAGKLALMRHVIDDGQLITLGETEARPEDNLLAQVLAYRDSLPPGELVDRIDVALNDAKDWLRNSPTVAMVAAILPLTEQQLDALFVWAHSQLGTV